ncbi:MAG: MBL fold metallo-hydrolase [Hyphomonadaceae bacterium]
MNAIGKSSVVFVTLSGLFWGGWVLGSQTPEGQEAIARAYATYAEQQAIANEDLFDSTALRALVCGGENAATQPCLAVVAAGRLFVVDAGSGAAQSLTQRGVPLARLQAVLLTSSGMQQMADLDEMYGEASRGRTDTLLPVYGPGETQRMVDGLNQAAGFDGAARGLQAWGPSPEPGRSVIVFEGDGLQVSAFTSQEDAFTGRVGYRFDYRGRSIVVGGDGRVVSASAAANADVVLQGAQSEALAHLHQSSQATAAQVATQAREANAGMVVLTGAQNQVEAQVQVSEARAAGFDDVVAGRVGMLVELPLDNMEINVRPL